MIRRTGTTPPSATPGTPARPWHHLEIDHGPPRQRDRHTGEPKPPPPIRRRKRRRRGRGQWVSRLILRAINTGKHAVRVGVAARRRKIAGERARVGPFTGERCMQNKPAGGLCLQEADRLEGGVWVCADCARWQGEWT